MLHGRTLESMDVVPLSWLGAKEEARLQELDPPIPKEAGEKLLGSYHSHAVFQGGSCRLTSFCAHEHLHMYTCTHPHNEFYGCEYIKIATVS